jgi:hypothetical protein
MQICSRYRRPSVEPHLDLGRRGAERLRDVVPAVVVAAGSVDPLSKLALGFLDEAG